MAILNLKHGFLFLAEPYSASRSIREALLTLAESIIVGQHDTFTELRERKLVDRRDLYNSFSIIRHPCDLLVTNYHQWTSWHSNGFDAFVRNRIENLPGRTIYRHTDSEDKLRFDNLQSEFRRCLRSYGVRAPEVKHLGATNDRKHWRHYFSTDLLEFVASRLDDFNTYGFTI